MTAGRWPTRRSATSSSRCSVAGHETTATALAWTLELLTHHPETLAAARRRLGRGLPEGRHQRVLRLRPVVPLAGRRLSPRRWTLTGSTLPEGHRRDAGDLARAHARRRLRRSVRLPARALARRRRAARVRVGAVRRRRAALPRRAFAEMEMRVALATLLALVRVEAAAGRARARGAPQRHLLARARNTPRPLEALSE